MPAQKSSVELNLTLLRIVSIGNPRNRCHSEIRRGERNIGVRDRPSVLCKSAKALPLSLPLLLPPLAQTLEFVLEHLMRGPLLRLGGWHPSALSTVLLQLPNARFLCGKKFGELAGPPFLPIALGIPPRKGRGILWRGGERSASQPRAPCCESCCGVGRHGVTAFLWTTCGFASTNTIASIRGRSLRTRRSLLIARNRCGGSLPFLTTAMIPA
eukprot:1679048-Pyramimonas_sp.AAC.1